MQAIGRQPQTVPDGAPIHYEHPHAVPPGAAQAAIFIANTEAGTGAKLPGFIKDEFDAFLECGIPGTGS